MTVVSFTDYTPVPRFDGIPWITILIDESTMEDGPWDPIDSIPMLPVDPDPAEPMARSFTTDNATMDEGWYRVSFVDVNNNVVQTAPAFHGEAYAWIPTLADVGSLVLARTRDHNGNVLGTFTDDTQPTDDQVRALIQKSVENVMPFIGTDIPEVLNQEAQDVVALRTAMYIELTFFSNEVAQNRSPYPEFKTLFDEKIATLATAVAAVEAGADPSDALVSVADQGYGYPAYAFPPPMSVMTNFPPGYPHSGIV